MMKGILKKYYHTPLIIKIVVAIAIGTFVGMFLPDPAIRFINIFNELFSQFLGFIIPLIIIGLGTPAISRIISTTGRRLTVTLIIAYSFTILSGLFAYCFSITLYPHIIDTSSADVLNSLGSRYEPYIKISIYPIMSVMTALAVSIIIGFGIGTSKAVTLQKCFEEFEDIINRTITFIIIPILPFFIIGLFINIAANGKVGQVLSSFLITALIIFVMSLILLLIQFCIAGIVARKNPIKMLLNMLPAYLNAISTSSSLKTIPVTIKQTIKNGVSNETANFVVPLCATTHLSGCMLKITSCAIALMLMQGNEISFLQILLFIMILGLTMIAAPSVPGGSIMISIGVMEFLLGFNSPQQALMITLYITMDSFGTACNVTGDGAIAVITNKFFNSKRFKDNNNHE
ncbi:MAG: cation:dicarboxylate symporter family transporter [Candidatus Limimorpha sp.]